MCITLRASASRPKDGSLVRSSRAAAGAGRSLARASFCTAPFAAIQKPGPFPRFASLMRNVLKNAFHRARTLPKRSSRSIASASATQSSA
jgi:hypothetical protein